MFWSNSSSLQAAKDFKAEQQAAAIRAGEQWIADNDKLNLSENLENAILSSSAPQIAENIKSKVEGWSATSVVTTYIKRAIQVHRRTNAATEILFVEALERAKALDEEFGRTGETKGPLHGVPVSLKDQIDYQGFDSTIGCSAAVGKPAKEHASLVKVLIEAGAVPFIKTGVPQTMLAFEAANPLWGIITNPSDPSRHPGGSSGGEAALISSDASPLGIGSDIGGSLRIPAHFSGCFGLKPCIGRFSTNGTVSPSPGFRGISSTMGPMGRSVDDLEIATRLHCNASVDLAKLEGLIPLPYRDITLPKKLKFGYYRTDGFCRASPACERAVMETVEALRKKGHKCVEFEPLDPVLALEYFSGLTSADGFKTLLGAIGTDPVESSLWLTTTGPKIPAFIRNTLVWIIKSVLGDSIFARILYSSRVKTVQETQRVAHERDVYVDKMRKNIWGDLKLDGVLCAPQATPAQKCGQTWDISFLAVGTFLWNTVDSTAAVIPVTRVDAVRDAVTPEWRARGRAGSKLVEKKVYDGPAAIYNAEEMHGLPVGVQLVAGQWEEEKCIAMARVIDEALGPRGYGPGEFLKRQRRY